MADRILGLGTLVKVDHDADASYTTVGLIKETTPPPRMREAVDATVLEDTLEALEPGLESAGEFTFMQVWDPTDTNHTMIDTLFANKTKVNWRVEFAAASPAITGTFAGWVKGLGPEKTDTKSVVSRTVTVQRTGAITWA